ncbi:MAG: hypothetical protein ACRDTS_21980 [Mycobacterium sp.]
MSQPSERPAARHGYTRINYQGSQTPVPDLTIAFTDLTDTATLQVSHTADGDTSSTTQPFPTGVATRVGSLEVTVNSINRQGSRPPTVSVEYRIS